MLPQSQSSTKGDAVDKTKSDDEKEFLEEKRPRGECVKIASVGKLKGDGLVATRDVKAGELILKENAILIDDCEEGYRNAFELMKSQYNKWLKILPYYKNKVGKNATQYEVFKSQVRIVI